MFRFRLSHSLLVAMLLALMPLAMVNAQEMPPIPATPVPGSAPTGVLAEFPLDVLPTPHAEVWFLRMGLDPEGSLPLGEQVGPVVVYVESGELTLASDRPVTVSTGGRPATPAAVDASPVASEFETVLQAGESVLIADGTMLAGRNDAGVPATFLVVLMFSAEREGEADDSGDQPVGLSQQGISVAGAEFPASPGTLTIERVVAEPGSILESDSGHGMGIGGLDLGAVEQGSADATFAMGSNWLWPNILTTFERQRPIDPGATVTLTAGDGYSTFDGSSTWTVTGDEPLILLRVVVMPA